MAKVYSITLQVYILDVYMWWIALCYDSIVNRTNLINKMHSFQAYIFMFQDHLYQSFNNWHKRTNNLYTYENLWMYSLYRVNGLTKHVVCPYERQTFHNSDTIVVSSLPTCYLSTDILYWNNGLVINWIKHGKGPLMPRLISCLPSIHHVYMYMTCWNKSLLSDGEGWRDNGWKRDASQP